MSLFDYQFMPPSSPNHRFVQSRPSNVEQFDHLEISGTHSEAVNDSSASYCAQELTESPSPSNSIQRAPEKKLEKSRLIIQEEIMDLANKRYNYHVNILRCRYLISNLGSIYKGPDVFGKLLGPTADESILVGLQVLLDMAGTLEFASPSANSSLQDNPTQYSNMSTTRDSREATAAISHHSSASCQCCNTKYQENPPLSSPEVVTEMRRNPCQYIITQENIAASVNTRENKCQQSQTRVLPQSMITYSPDKGELYGASSMNMVTRPITAPKKVQSPVESNTRTASPPLRKSTSSSPSTPTTSPNCPCSQFYHQMTTISVMENSPELSHPFVPSVRKRSLSPIIDDNSSPLGLSTCDVSVESEIIVQQKNKRVSCEPCKQIKNKPIQTKPLSPPIVHDVEMGTELAMSQERNSVACDCNICMPISAGVSSPPSKRRTNVSKLTSVVRFSEDEDKDCACSLCCVARVKEAEEMRKKEKDIPALRNKSCVCSLIPNFKVTDAACSSLKVNTSCQYHKCEIVPVESRSTQCRKCSRSRTSSTLVCSEAGDYRPQKKKSVRIISGPYECANFSETGYCMEPKKSVSRTVIPLLECNDEISRICFEKPTRVCLEMGDSCIPPPMEIRYAITKITKFRDFSTFEVMKSTSKKPKCMPKAVEGVFVLKKEENCCGSKTYE